MPHIWPLWLLTKITVLKNEENQRFGDQQNNSLKMYKHQYQYMAI